jgi:pimeloyl-ACP methyl ester carboxylesterase
MPHLVTAQSEDGLTLEGMAWEGSRHDLGFVLIHGIASRFYARAVACVAEAVAARGFPAVSGNTRGHDYGALVSRAQGGFVLQGAAWEDPSEGPRDVAGWVAWAPGGLGVDRVVLVGHSLGGWKCTLFQSQRQDPAVAGLALLSPGFRPTPVWWRDDHVAAATSLVESGRGDELLAEPRTRIGRLSARSYLARHPERWSDTLPDLLRRVSQPVFASYGTGADIGGPEQLTVLAGLAPHITTRLVDGADHNYTGCWDAVAAALVEWVGTWAGAPAG